MEERIFVSWGFGDLLVAVPAPHLSSSASAPFSSSPEITKNEE